MKVACIQLSSGENYNKNFKQVIFYINQAIKKKADLIITPELHQLLQAIKKYFIRILTQ
jgi:predicted amidohydrolase